MLAAAILLKSKRVPPRLDLLVALPSRQVLEVLSSSGALIDLLATGARLVEPDARVMSGHMYPPPPSGGLSARTCDPEPGARAMSPSWSRRRKRSHTQSRRGNWAIPLVQARRACDAVPRALPTDDVLNSPRARADIGGQKEPNTPSLVHPVVPSNGALTLEVVRRTLPFVGGAVERSPLERQDQPRRPLQHARRGPPALWRIAHPTSWSTCAPSSRRSFRAACVALFSGVALPQFRSRPARRRGFRGKRIALPAPTQWAERQSTPIALGLVEDAVHVASLGADAPGRSADRAGPAPKAARP